MKTILRWLLAALAVAFTCSFLGWVFFDYTWWTPPDETHLGVWRGMMIIGCHAIALYGVIVYVINWIYSE